MTDADTAISEGADLLDDLAPLLAVPALLSLLNVSNLLAATDSHGKYLGLNFPLPAPVGDLWTFVNPPGDVSGGAGSSLPIPVIVDGPDEMLPAFLLGTVVYVVIESALTAGYVGSIQEHRQHGSYDFVANARRYWIDYLALLAFLFGVLLVIVPFVAAVPRLIVLVFLGMLVATYLFWGAWFLIPVADVGAVDALQRSYGLATTEHDYAVWSLVYLLIGAVLSLFLTAVVTDGGLLGVFLGLCFAVPVGFILTVGSLRVIDDLDDRPPPAGSGTRYHQPSADSDKTR